MITLNELQLLAGDVNDAIQSLNEMLRVRREILNILNDPNFDVADTINSGMNLAEVRAKMMEYKALASSSGQILARSFNLVNLGASKGIVGIKSNNKLGMLPLESDKHIDWGTSTKGVLKIVSGKLTVYKENPPTNCGTGYTGPVSTNADGSLRYCSAPSPETVAKILPYIGSKIPTGIIMPYIINGPPPEGWLYLKGGTIPSGTLYDPLRAMAGGNTLPDARGRFIRVYDDGDGTTQNGKCGNGGKLPIVDVDRDSRHHHIHGTGNYIGSVQEYAMVDHSHKPPFTTWEMYKYYLTPTTTFNVSAPPTVTNVDVCSVATLQASPSVPMDSYPTVHPYASPTSSERFMELLPPATLVNFIVKV
jgi:hypothetical protein